MEATRCPMSCAIEATKRTSSGVGCREMVVLLCSALFLSPSAFPAAESRSICLSHSSQSCSINHSRSWTNSSGCSIAIFCSSCSTGVMFSARNKDTAVLLEAATLYANAPNISPLPGGIDTPEALSRISITSSSSEARGDAYSTPTVRRSEGSLTNCIAAAASVRS